MATTQRTAVRAAATLACVLASGGCGAADSPQETSPAESGAAVVSPAELAECVASFNATRAADFGRHSYADHHAREAQVSVAGGQCAVIFAVYANDPEYGAVGEIERGGSWISLGELGESEAKARQRAAADALNARLDRAGRVRLR